MIPQTWTSFVKRQSQQLYLETHQPPPAATELRPLPPSAIRLQLEEPKWPEDQRVSTRPRSSTRSAAAIAPRGTTVTVPDGKATPHPHVTNLFMRVKCLPPLHRSAGPTIHDRRSPPGDQPNGRTLAPQLALSSSTTEVRQAQFAAGSIASLRGLPPRVQLQKCRARIVISTVSTITTLPTRARDFCGIYFT